MPLAMNVSNVSCQQPLRLTPGPQLFAKATLPLCLGMPEVEKKLCIDTPNPTLLKELRLYLRLPSANGTLERQSCSDQLLITCIRQSPSR